MTPMAGYSGNELSLALDITSGRECPKFKRLSLEAGRFALCAEHVRQLEGESPFDNLMEVKS